MTTNPVYVVDIMARIVALVNAELSFPVYYQYGRSPEVINSLDRMTGTSVEVTKYPLIYLVMPFKEENPDMEQNFSVDLRIIILAPTDQNWLTAQRYADVFKPTLYPIYQALIKSIAYSGYFADHSELQIKHTKTDWPHFGEKGNFANDFTDAIDISNLQLRVNFNYCKTI